MTRAVEGYVYQWDPHDVIIPLSLYTYEIIYIYIYIHIHIYIYIDIDDDDADDDECVRVAWYMIYPTIM